MSDKSDFLAALNEAGLVTKTTIKVIPAKEPTGLPKGAVRLDSSGCGPTHRKVSDCFYSCGKNVAKVLYTKIDERFKNSDTHHTKFTIAKNILNEQRNLALDAVLPMFDVYERGETDTEYTKGDDNARDLFINNLWLMLTCNYLSWIPEFVLPADVSATAEVLANVSSVYKAKLEAELRTFRFIHRRVVAPVAKQR